MAVLTAVAPVRTSFIAPKVVSGKVSVRKSVYALSDDEVSTYRLAIARIAQISADNVDDHRGFQYVAGLHGRAGNFCQHLNRAFALWHRPYMQGFEQRLQDVITEATMPYVTLPYWDWTTKRAQNEGLPQIFLDAQWHNPVTGNDEPNPLRSQPILRYPEDGPTERSPQDPAGLIELAGLVQDALRAPDYLSFTHELENPHGKLHMWVGGHMSDQNYAAYDPLFFAHHSFVENLFCQWQDAHPEAQAPDVDPLSYNPFGVTTDKIWYYRTLGYQYEPDNSLEPHGTATPLDLQGDAGAGSVEFAGLKSGSTVASFPFHDIVPDFGRAEVRFEGLTPPEMSFEIRVFANEPGANAGTPTHGDNPHYLGSQFFFGHGQCIGAAGHCDPVARDVYDLRPKHHYAPTQVRLNVTRRLRNLILKEQPSVVPITLVAVDRNGTEIPDPGLMFEGLMIVVR